MDLLPRSQFDLRLMPAADHTAPLSEILLGGQPTGAAISGAVLEAALRCTSGFLVFTTDDVPHEETLHIHLLSPALTVLDEAAMGAMYSTGFFSDLAIVDADTVRFEFFGGTPWTLTLHAQPRLALPWVSDPKGVRRPLALHRYFQLSGNPQPSADA